MIRYFTEERNEDGSVVRMSHDFAESDLLEAARLLREHPEPENAATGCVFEALCWLDHQRYAPYRITSEEVM